MRRRITYVHGPGDAFDPSQLSLSSDTLSVTNLHAAKEERLTFGFSELPEEIWSVLKQSHELRLRWVTERDYTAVAPFSSRLAPGLHVLFSPKEKGGDVVGLCPLLKMLFNPDLKCLSAQTSFVSQPLLSERFASGASMHYYHTTPSISEFVNYIQETACSGLEDKVSCEASTASLLQADYIDLDFDSISHALILNAYWSKAPDTVGWTEKITKDVNGQDKVEVGVLANERTQDKEELSLGGFLAVVGEDEKLTPTLFSFPARHHPLPIGANFTSSFQNPTGLHPTLEIKIPYKSLAPPPAPESSSCALLSYLTLPSGIFADKYQLSTSDILFLKSHNLLYLRSIAGETDLEAPDWVVPRWGSTLMLQLALPDVYSSGTDPAKLLRNMEGTWDITVPLHLRYLEPDESGRRSLQVPTPLVMWACTAEEGTKMAVNPFDRVNLGWDALLGTRSMFYQLTPATNEGQEGLVMSVDVPVLSMNTAEGMNLGRQMIEAWTIATVLMGFLWILYKLGVVDLLKVAASSLRQLRPAPKVEDKDKKKK